MTQRVQAEPQLQQGRAAFCALGEVREELDRMISQLAVWKLAPVDGSSWLSLECATRNLENAAVALRQLTYDTRVADLPRGGPGAGA